MKARDIHLSGYEFKVVKIQQSADGNSIYSPVLMQQDAKLGVSMGLMEGYSTVDKFGVNLLVEPLTDPEDVWEGGGLYNYDADNTAPIISIASNNAADNQEVSILGHDRGGRG